MLTETYPKLAKTVFVVTYGRSGSTVLQNMLNALPGYVVRGENNNLLAPLVKAWHDLREFYPGQTARMKPVQRPPSRPHQPWFGYEGIDPDAFGAGLAEVFVRNVLRPGPDTVAAGFKEIRWHREPGLFEPTLEFLRTFMPGAHFIFNTRDLDAVLQSGWWKNADRDEALAELSAAEALFKTWQARHPGGGLALKYEEFTSGPEAWRPLFDYLGEPFDAALIQSVLDKKLRHMKPK